MDTAGELLCSLKEPFRLRRFTSEDSGTVLRKTKICGHYQPHLDFTKSPKLGHLGAHSLENDSLGLYYLSEEFILLVSSPSSSPLPPLSSFFYPPPSFFCISPSSLQCAPGAVVGWVRRREDEGMEARCCNRALSSSLCRAVASRGETQ